jgi:hypothetical protein
MSERDPHESTSERGSGDRSRRLAVSALSIASGIVVLFGFSGRLTSDQLVYAVVATVVLVGWALRAFWTREILGANRWPSLVWAVLGGFTLATLYIWLAPRLGL